MGETFSPITWVNDGSPALNATNLNRLETGIEAIDDRTAALELGIDTPVVLAYAASMAINASQGALFRITATGNLSITDITTGTNGQEITIEVLASGANRTLTVGGTTSTIPAGQWWSGSFRYNAGLDQWLFNGGSSVNVGPGSVTDASVATGAAISLDKTADGTRLAMTAAERTKLSGIATGATVYTDEQAMDAAAAMITTATHSGISWSYNDAANQLSATVSGGGGGGDAATPYGVVFLDDFAGADDDAKLTAALAATTADTYPRTIQLRAKQYTFATGNRACFTGMRLQGPAGYGNPERVSGTKMPGRVHLTMSGPWFHNNAATVFSCSFHQMSFTGGSNATVVGQSGGGSWYCLSMRDIFSSGTRTVLGTQATTLLITAASFTGDWEINNCYNGAFHIGGSDNVLWQDGCLLDSDPAFNTAGSANGQYHLWMDSLEKSEVGPMYITAEGPWAGVRVTGPAYGAVTSNTGSNWWHGMRIEGRNKDQPSNGALLRVEGGVCMIRDSWFGYAMSSPATPGHSPQDAGVIHHSGGGLSVHTCMYDRATGVAETVPFIYANSSGPTRVSNIFIAGRGGAWTGLPRVQDVGSGTLTADSSVTVV